jgi:hypothetical protein
MRPAFSCTAALKGGRYEEGGYEEYDHEEYVGATKSA